ncbi:MAG: sigma-54-dependent transcriptional regulator [Bdellovibrionales bacterium]
MRDLTLFVVDDDDLLLAAMRPALPPSWRLVAHDRPQGLPDGPFHAALIDMHLTGNLQRAEGLEVIKTLRQQDPHLDIIAMSGNLDRDLMEKGLKAGASRFLAKPLHPEELNLMLAKIEEWWLLQGALSRKTKPVRSWLGNSAAARDVQKQIAALKGERGPILLEGESGTGKEVVTELLHHQREGTPLVPVNVAGIPDNLFESELFGHVRGAFTGADQNKMGLAEAAHGGDLFLDEVEALPLHLQAKLLRFLETGEVRRVGGKDAIQVQCRVIAATNRSLQQMVNEGKFREDLLWRLSGKKINLPPLRERREDIRLLAETFLKEEQVRRKTLADDGAEALSEYSWPGNVRELRRVCEQLSLQSPLPMIRRQDVLSILQPTAQLENQKPVDFALGLPNLVNQFEAQVISSCLERYQDIDEVARLLQVSRSNLYKKIKDHNIQWRDT